jgi:hypothetical protein
MQTDDSLRSCVGGDVKEVGELVGFLHNKIFLCRRLLGFFFLLTYF